MPVITEEHIRQQRAELREQKRATLESLVRLKFGPDRGAISSAAKTIEANIGNFSQMLKGGIGTPQKYIDALMALPDYVAPQHVPVPALAGWDLRVTLSIKAHELLRDICNSHAKNFCAPNTPDVYAQVLEQIIKKTHTDYLAAGWLDFKYKKVAAPSLDDILS